MADWIKGVTMDEFFNRIGNVAAGNGGACPILSTFKFGFGYVDESGGTPDLLDIPSTLEEIPGVVLTGDLGVTYNGGKILCTCLVKEGDVVAPIKVSVAGIYDTTGALIAAANFYPDWITPDEEYRVNIGLVFTANGE